MRRFSLVGLVVLGSGLAHGQESLSTEAAVKLTLAHSPRVKALLHELSAAERGLAAARAWTNPSISITPGFTRAGSDEELLIAQPLELNGVRSARSGVAGAQRRAAEATCLIELGEIVFQTKTAYIALARAQDRRSLALDLLKNAEALDRSAKRQVELGSRPGIEHTQISIELSRARQQSVLAEAEHVASLAEFLVAIGRPVEATVALPPLQFHSETVDEEDLVMNAVEQRGEIALALATKDSFLQEARLARAEGLPDLTPHFRASSFTRNPRESGFGIGISIPLLDFGSRRNRIRQAEESAKAQDQRLAASRAQVRQEVQQAVARLRAADAVLKSFQGGMLDDARRLIEATRHGFELGATSIVAVLEAQRTFRAVQIEYIDALVSHEQARAQLERATGAVQAMQLRELRQPTTREP